MDNRTEQGIVLLSLFGEFYEEVARVKLAIREGKLALYLATDVSAPALNGNELAAMLGQRLKVRLQEQGKYVASVGLQAEIDAYRFAQYAMTVLADELFILDVEWPGQDAWQYNLLEQSLFDSSNGGREFFTKLDELLGTRASNPLLEDVAAVYLMSLRLGFKGQYRGSRGESQLKHYTDRLFRFVGRRSGASQLQPAFIQAYQHRIAGTRDERMAPLSRWYKLGAIGFAMYIVISTIVWMVITNRFTQAFGG